MLIVVKVPHVEKRRETLLPRSARRGEVPYTGGLLGTARVVALQGSAGNGAVTLLLQRDATTTFKPHVVELYGERVEVRDDDEKAEAARIIRVAWQKYGIKVSSARSLVASHGHYKGDADADALDAIRASTWKLDELQALELALAHFAPILGDERKRSTRSGAGQEITSAGKLTQSVDPVGKADTKTLAEAFTDSKNISVYNASDAGTTDFATHSEELVGTTIHELAHGLMDYALDDWKKALDFWEDEFPSRKPRAEAPLTQIGVGGPGEDLSESVSFYFLEPATLKGGKGKANGEVGNPCPMRFALVDKFVKAWKRKR